MTVGKYFVHLLSIILGTFVNSVSWYQLPYLQIRTKSSMQLKKTQKNNTREIADGKYRHRVDQMTLLGTRSRGNSWMLVECNV